MTTTLNGWEYPSPGLKTFNIPGADRRATLDRDAGRVLVALAAEYHQTVRPIDIGPWDEGGYNDRDARLAAGRKSNHANGTAIDLNWSEEGAMGSNWGRRFFAKLSVARRVRELKKRYSVLQWGGDWRARDYMHWEIKPGVTRAEVRAFCRAEGIDSEGRRKKA